MADPNNSGGDPSALSPELLAAIDEKLGKSVNAMISARLTGFKKDLDASLSKTLGESLKSQLPDLLKDFRPSEEPPPEPGKGGKKDQATTELATIKAQLQTMITRNEQAEQRAAALWQRQRETSLRDQASKVLGAAGITGDRFDAAYALLVQSGRVKLSEDSESTDGLFSDPTTGDVSIDVGLGSWLKSDTAKIFIPPTGTRGSGSTPTGLGRGANLNNLTPEQRQAQVRNNLAAALERDLGR